MPPVLGSGVGVADPFEVLGGQQWHGVFAVADGEQGHLGAVEELLDDHRATGLRVRQGRLAVGGDDNPLAGGQTVVLDHVRRPEPVERGLGLLGGGADPGGRRRHPGRLHHLLGEGLGALQPGGLGRRPEARETGGAQGASDPGDEWGLGPDDHQVGGDPVRQGDHGVGIADIDVVAGAEPGQARVAGRDVEGAIGRKGPAERVLAPTGADQENSGHAVNSNGPLRIGWGP